MLVAIYQINSVTSRKKVTTTFSLDEDIEKNKSEEDEKKEKETKKSWRKQ
jgi:hypothetical protein